VVSFLPDDDVGVVVFANVAEAPLTNISNRIIDAALHLRSELSPPMFVFHYYDLFLHLTLLACASSIPEKKAVTPPPENIIGLELALEEFSGTYTNPGYGTFTFCDPSSSSLYCQQVITDFAIVDAAQPNAPSSPQLLTAWPRFWGSHTRAVHQSGNKFLFYCTTLFPEGYGRDSTPFEMETLRATAEFVVEDGKVVGFGLFDMVGQVTERERTHTTVKNRADVWFDQI